MAMDALVGWGTPYIRIIDGVFAGMTFVSYEGILA
jgi:hypothetical protein